MGESSLERATVGSVEVRDEGMTTRRDAVRRLASGAALAAFASTAFSGVTAAQSATPPADETKEGLYVVLRTRKLKPETDIDALTATLREGLVPQIEAISGFVEYYIVQNAETRDRTSVSIFRDRSGADESTTLAGAFLRENNLADLYVDVNPVIVEGSIILFAG